MCLWHTSSKNHCWLPSTLLKRCNFVSDTFDYEEPSKHSQASCLQEACAWIKYLQVREICWFVLLLPSWSFSICSIVTQFWSLFKRDAKVYTFAFLTCTSFHLFPWESWSEEELLPAFALIWRGCGYYRGPLILKAALLQWSRRFLEEEILDLIFNPFCQVCFTRASSKEKEGNLGTSYLFVRGNKV